MTITSEGDTVVGWVDEWVSASTALRLDVCAMPSCGAVISARGVGRGKRTWLVIHRDVVMDIELIVKKRFECRWVRWACVSSERGK